MCVRTWVLKQVVGIYDDGLLSQLLRHQLVDLIELDEANLRRFEAVPALKRIRHPYMQLFIL